MTAQVCTKSIPQPLPLTPQPVLQKKKKSKEEKSLNKCLLKDCLLCTKGLPSIYKSGRGPTWSNIMHIVLWCLQHSNKETGKEFFNLKEDIYAFVIAHWNVLKVDKKGHDGWHKQIQDALSHDKVTFQSGCESLKKSGNWGLAMDVDPWNSSKLPSRINKRKSPQSPMSSAPKLCKRDEEMKVLKESVMATSRQNKELQAQLASKVKELNEFYLRMDDLLRDIEKETNKNKAQQEEITRELASISAYESEMQTYLGKYEEARSKTEVGWFTAPPPQVPQTTSLFRNSLFPYTGAK